MTTITEFVGSVQKCQTLADNGLRFTFDAPETAILAMSELVAYKTHGVAVKVTVEPIETETLTDLDDETQKDPEGICPEVDRRRIAIRRDKRASG